VKFAFDAEQGLVMVFAELFGPLGSAVLRMAARYRRDRWLRWVTIRL